MKAIKTCKISGTNYCISLCEKSRECRKTNEEYCRIVNDEFISNLSEKELNEYISIDELHSIRVSEIAKMKALDIINNNREMFKAEIEYLLNSENISNDQKEILRRYKKIFEEVF